MKKLVLFILIVLLLACILYVFHTSRPVRKDLLLADSLMTEHADSSLSILQNIKTPIGLSDKNRALYALLMTQAMFKNYLSVESDSLIRIAADYYKESRDSLRKGWAFYYSARVYQNMDEEKKALDYYQKASIAASATRDYKLLDLIYNYWGLLLQKKKPYNDGIQKLKKSLEYSELRKDTLGQIQVLSDLGWSCIWKEDYAQALLYFQKGLKLIKATNNIKLLSSFYHNLGVLYWRKKNYNLALNYINKSLRLEQDSLKVIPSYNVMAGIYLGMHKYDSSRFYINKVGMGITFYSKANYYNNLSKLEKGVGNYKEAIVYRDLYMAYNDSIENAEDDIEITKLQKKYDYSVIENENSILKIERQNRNIFVLLLLVIMIAIVFSGYFYFLKECARKEKSLREKEDLLRFHLLQSQNKTILLQQQQQELFAREEELKQSVQREMQLTDNISDKEEKLSAFQLREEELAGEIMKIKEELHLHSQKEQELKKCIFNGNAVVKKILSLDTLSSVQRIKLKEQFVLSPEEQDDLFKAVNICFDNFVDRLRLQYPKLMGDDVYLCCLLRMNLTKNNILLLMDITEDALKKRKQRIKSGRIEELKDNAIYLMDFLSSF